MSVGEGTMILFVFSVFIMSAAGQTEPVADPSYVAAVYEHHVILNPNPHFPLTRSAALEYMQKNLDIYEKQAALAAQQGAQILVFPEDGLHGFNFSRLSIAGYLETIPDPQQNRWNPCTEPGRYNNTEVLRRLSCIARNYSLYLVANMPDLQPCPLKSNPSTSCPKDGHWQFNTDVVFSSDGQLVARYHKQNLFHEEEFDTPPQPEIITFDTPFGGTFGLFTCFDILFHEPTITLVEKVCALVRCAELDCTSCGQEVKEAETKIDFVLEGKFGTRYVYPSILVSNLVLERPKKLEKTEDGRVTMNHSSMTGGLVTASLYGRMYHLDNDILYSGAGSFPKPCVIFIFILFFVF